MKLELKKICQNSYDYLKQSVTKVKKTELYEVTYLVAKKGVKVGILIATIYHTTRSHPANAIDSPNETVKKYDRETAEKSLNRILQEEGYENLLAYRRKDRSFVATDFTRFGSLKDQLMQSTTTTLQQAPKIYKKTSVNKKILLYKGGIFVIVVGATVYVCVKFKEVFGFCAVPAENDKS